MRNMTSGSIYRHLLAYAVPLIFGNFLQLTYNAVDSIVVSKGAGVAALSAVSVSNPVSVLLIQSVSGLGIGASVYMSKYYGAGDTEKLKRSLSTTLIFGTLAGFLVMLLGVMLSRPILGLMNTPAAIMTDSLTYLRLLFIGNFFTFQYNIMSSALRAVGDSKTPVTFVGISSVLNAVLDCIFIFLFHWGVFGAALATIIAEALSAVLCFVYVHRHIPALRLRREELIMDHELLKKILSSGLITALQQSCQPIGKLLVQSVINVQGIDVIAAFNAGCKIEDYGRIPAQTISHGMMTCAAQNRGAGDRRRVKETLWKGILIGLIYYPIICILILLFRRPLIQLFAPDTGAEEMIRLGVAYLSVKAFTIVFPCLTNAMQGFMRGMGNMSITLVSTILQIAVRTVFVYILVPRIGITGEAYACAIGWTCMILFEYSYYFIFRKRLYAAVSPRPV